MLGEEPEGLHVEDKTVGGPFHPQAGVSGRGQAVVGAVYLDDGELGHIVTQPRLGRMDTRRIEAPGFNECLLCPRGDADKDWGYALNIALNPVGGPCRETDTWVPPGVVQRVADDRQNTTSRGYSCAILGQNPPLQSMTTANCHSSGVALITASTIFRPQPLMTEVSA